MKECVCDGCPPAVGRFTTVDPLADAQPAWNPYRYSLNNPLRFTDPTGMAEEDQNSAEEGYERMRQNRQKTYGTLAGEYRESGMGEIGTVDSEKNPSNENNDEKENQSSTDCECGTPPCPPCPKTEEDNSISALQTNLVTGADIAFGSLFYSVAGNIDKQSPMLDKFGKVYKSDITRLRYNLFGVTFKGYGVVGLRSLAKYGGPTLGFYGVYLGYNSGQSTFANSADVVAYGASFMKGGYSISTVYTFYKTAIANYWNMTPEVQYQTYNPYWYNQSRLQK